MLKYLVFILFYFIVSNSLKSVLEYGEFDLKLTKVELCNGPKRKTCAELSLKIVDDVLLNIEMNVTEDMKTVKGKVIGSINDKDLLRMQIKNLCDHIVVKPLIQTFMTKSDNCAITKGRYRFSVNVQTLTRNFNAGKFVYGNWKFKWIFYNDYCSMQCATLYISIIPKGLAAGNT